MKYWIEAIICWPFLAFFLSLLLPKSEEKLISRFVFGMMGAHFLASLCFIAYWWWQGGEPVNIRELSVFKNSHIEFFVDFYFDYVSAVYLAVGAFLVFLVTTYSRIYLHRESGYKRFFYTKLFFYSGYTLTVFAGNLETLFIGWEILGITSFLLIAFYRNRYLPVRNAFKVFSIYRIGDVGIILAMWANHHLWHENITFEKLGNYAWVHHHLEGHTLFALFTSLAILTAAAAKSAQFPFSSWLPRAMEGPTPSSAIFYGSLSVHLGVFLLLRTMPFWIQQDLARIAIGLTGLVTAVIATWIARVQSSMKSQVAYASVAQIGLIFMELALGLEVLALVHFAGNAFLRTYQLLASPSAVSYLIREQFYHHEDRQDEVGTRFSTKLRYTIYLLSVKEWNMDYYMNRLIWQPMKDVGHLLRYLTPQNVFYFSVPSYVVGLLLWVYRQQVPPFVVDVLPELFSFLGLVLVFRAYAARQSVIVPWVLLVFNHLWVVLAIAFNDALSTGEILFYLQGILAAGTVGWLLLLKLRKLEPTVDLNSYQGHVYEYPKLAAVFLLTCLGVAGFPITTTFVGEDIIFAHIDYQDVVLAFFIASGFVVSGIALIRMYARIFLGPHVKSYHEVAGKSM